MKIRTKEPFLIDIENFNKKLTEGIWAKDGFGILHELIKPKLGGLCPRLDEDAGGPIIPIRDKGAMDKSF